jgi:tripeptide aminopeptidase
VTAPDRLHENLIDLCRIPSPSFHEGAVAAYVRREVEALGLEVEEDDAGQVLGSDTGNLIVRTPGVGDPFLLIAHMDTVPPTPVEGMVPVVVEGDRVHTGGRSILGADDKAGVAMALEMLRHAVSAPERVRPLDVIFTIQEEQGTRGASHLDPARLRAQYGFSLDGDTPVGVAIHEAPHKLRYTIDVRGRAAHAAVNPEDGINAVQAAGAVAAALPGGKVDDHSTANVGRIEGGGATNIVPDAARLIGEARSLRRERLDALKAAIAATASRESGRRGATASVTWEELYAGYCVPVDAPPAVLFAACCAGEGMQASFVSTYGGGDANPLNEKGVQCIVFGLGMERIHTPEEYILLSNLSQAARILKWAIQTP